MLIHFIEENKGITSIDKKEKRGWISKKIIFTVFHNLREGGQASYWKKGPEFFIYLLIDAQEALSIAARLRAHIFTHFPLLKT